VKNLFASLQNKKEYNDFEIFSGDVSFVNLFDIILPDLNISKE